MREIREEEESERELMEGWLARKNYERSGG